MRVKGGATFVKVRVRERKKSKGARQREATERGESFIRVHFTAFAIQGQNLFRLFFGEF